MYDSAASPGSGVQLDKGPVPTVANGDALLTLDGLQPQVVDPLAYSILQLVGSDSAL